MSVWFITGASRGFGRDLVAAALEAGDQVVAAARRPEVVREEHPDAGEALLAVELDVTDEAQGVAAFDAAVERFGRVDVLVNNAGYGLFGAIEEITDVEARALFDVNVFGVLNVTRAALPALRSQGAGRVINMSSSAGFASSSGRGLYSASKFAVEAISEALREELAPFGVHVTAVEPGSFRTEFLSSDSRRTPSQSLPAYADSVGAFQEAVAGMDGQQPGDPAQAVSAIRRLASLDGPPLRLQLGSDCVGLVEGKLATVADELDRWRDLALSTDFSQAGVDS